MSLGGSAEDGSVLGLSGGARGSPVTGVAVGNVTGVTVSQRVWGLFRGSREFLLTRTEVGAFTGVSQWCQCLMGCQGMSEVVRWSPVKGTEMKDVTGVSASWGCWAVLGGCQGVLRGCWGSQGVPVHWGGRGGCHRGVSVQDY